MSKVKALYHIVFCTKSRCMTIPKTKLEDLYRFIWAEIRERKCKLIRIGGIGNHVHMLIDLNPTVALSELIKAIKAKSSGWLRSNPDFPDFESWASEYYACTLSPDDEPKVIEYIKGQYDHHTRKSFEEELQSLHGFAGLTIHNGDMV